MNIEGKNVLITGGDGFIGRNLILRLSQEACNVSVVSKHPFDCTAPGCVSIAGDLESEGFCEDVLKNVDICFHLASVKKNFEYHLKNPAEIFFDNVSITEALFRSLLRSKVKKLIAVSSVAVYQEQAGHIDEHGALRADRKDAYSASKIVMEMGAEFLSRQKPDLSVIVARLDNVYGIGDHFGEHSQVVPSLIRKAVDEDEIVVWGSGNQERTFIYVEDAVDALVRLVEHDGRFDIFNVSRSERITLKNLIQKILNHLRLDKTIRFDLEKPEGMKARLISAQKIREALTWEPSHTLDEGLKKTIDYYLKLNK